MVPNPLTVAPEDTLRAAAELLTSAGIGGAPVVSGGMVIGVVTLTDILAFEANNPGVVVGKSETFELEPGEEPATHEGDHVERLEWNALDEYMVAEVMSRGIIHVTSTTPVREAARLMERERVHRLIVLENGAAAGILSFFDLVRAVARGVLRLVPIDRR